MSLPFGRHISQEEKRIREGGGKRGEALDVQIPIEQNALLHHRSARKVRARSGWHVFLVMCSSFAGAEAECLRDSSYGSIRGHFLLTLPAKQHSEAWKASHSIKAHQLVEEHHKNKNMHRTLADILQGAKTPEEREARMQAAMVEACIEEVNGPPGGREAQAPGGGSGPPNAGGVFRSDGQRQGGRTANDEADGDAIMANNAGRKDQKQAEKTKGKGKDKGAAGKKEKKPGDVSDGEPYPWDPKGDKGTKQAGASEGKAYSTHWGTAYGQKLEEMGEGRKKRRR